MSTSAGTAQTASDQQGPAPEVVAPEVPGPAPDETPVPALTLLPLPGVSCSVDGHCD